MGRPNSVMTHPQRLEIERALGKNESLVSIAQRIGGVSVSSLSRYAIAKKDQLRRLHDGETGPADLATRYKDLAESSRRLRLLADAAGNVSERARAIATERDVLNAIRDGLGIDDLSVTEVMTDTRELLGVLARFVVENPEAASDLIARMRKHEHLADLARGLEETK